MRTAALRVCGLFTAAAAASISGACINDRDTVIREVQSPPGVLTALTGRFERLPAVYYQARVDRIRKIARPTPEDLDDLGAALDRLGRSKAAYDVMQRKAKMPGLSKEARYRLHANRGTFLAHHLLKSKAPIAELKPAIRDIEEAIRIKPNAHFGREGVQLRVLKWMHQRGINGGTTDLGTLLKDDAEPEKTATALAGLIELGNAWESPDIVAAIGRLCRNQTRTHQGPDKDQTITEFQRGALYAKFRYDELASKGIKPVHKQPWGYEWQAPQHDSDAYDRWDRERAFAESRTKLRAAYVQKRILAGEHPDTHPAFWSRWREPTNPDAGLMPEERTRADEATIRNRDALDRWNSIPAWVYVVGLLTPFATVGAFIYRRRM